MSFSYLREYLLRNNFRRSGQQINGELVNMNNDDIDGRMSRSSSIILTNSSKSPSKSVMGKDEHLLVSMMSFGQNGAFERAAIKAHFESNPKTSVFFAMNTNLNERINWNIFEMKGFNVYRQDLTSGSGGIMVYVRDTLQVSLLDDLEHEVFEAIWFKITHPEKYTNVATGTKDDIVTIGEMSN